MSDTSVRTPREVAEEQLRLFGNGEFGAAADLYAEDVVVEIPFAKPPVRVEGRAQLKERVTALGGRLELTVENPVVRATDDPEVVVTEFDYHGRVTATGKEFRVTNVLILRIRDGRIVASRDFHDHVAINEAFAE